jgi:hypothetical protein
VERTAVVVVCAAAATGIPNFALAMGFMGSVTLPLLTFVFPALFYLKLHGEGAGGGMRLACVVVILAGGLGCVGGLASNIHLASRQ